MPKSDLGEEGELQDHGRSGSGDPQDDPPGDDHPGPPRAPGQDLDQVEVAQVGVGPHVDLLLGSCSATAWLRTCRSGFPGRAMRSPSGAPARRDHRLALVDVLGGVDEVEDQVVGIADSGSTIPLDAGGTTFAETALEWSVISVTWAEPPVTAVTLPTSPSPLTTGSSTRTPSLAADVDRHVGEPDGRRARDHPAGNRVCSPRDRAPPRSSSSSLRSCAFSASAACSAPTACVARVCSSAWSGCSRPRASKVSSNQLTRSRAGFRARSATAWTGLKTVADAALQCRRSPAP